MDYDIIVGVSTRDCEKTISNIVQTLDKTLTKHFSKYNSLILCSDGFSSDKTKQKFNDTKTITEKKFVTEKGKRGKGSAIKTILQKASSHGTSATLLLDGDFVNIKEKWIKSMITPVLNKKYDVVIPYYLRDKNDCLITNHLIYPLFKSLFDSGLRYPVAGEFCLSQTAYKQLLQSRFFPTDYGIDVFITLTALCESMNVAELKLGAKEHASSNLYTKPDTSVMPMFNQILKEFIQLIRYYKSIIKQEQKLKYGRLGSFEKKKPSRIKINEKSYAELSRDMIANSQEYAEKVYESLNDQSIMGLKVAWLNWLTIYFDKTKNYSNERAEKEIIKLAKVFETNKEMLKL